MPLAKHIFGIDQRRVAREQIRVAARLRRKAPPYGPPEDALLLNISRFGFLARTDMRIIDGSLIAIEIPVLGEIKARAVWSMENNIGAEFLSAIDPASYFELVTRLSAEAFA